MAQIHTSLPPEALDGDWGKLSADAALELSAPGKEPLQVHTMKMRIHNSKCSKDNCSNISLRSWHVKSFRQSPQRDCIETRDLPRGTFAQAAKV